MFVRLKALIVVLAIALLMFGLGRIALASFAQAADWNRRRNVWILLTIAAFAAPGYWWFAVVAVVILLQAARRDSNPIALYLLLLHVVPPVQVDLPAIGFNKLFEVDNYRLLAFCVLIPAVVRFRRANRNSASLRLDAMDWLLLLWGAIQIVLFVPPDLPGQPLLQDSPTNFVRRVFLFFPDIYVTYYAVSRLCWSRRLLVEAMASYCMGALILAAVAVYETGRHWLLYEELTKLWSESGRAGFYLFRGNSLRAEAASGHALALGYLLAIAFGFWLYLKSEITSRWARMAGIVVLWLGLLATYSRGPWIAAFSIYFLIAALRPGGPVRLVKATLVAAVLIGLLALTPLGERLINALPLGTKSVDAGTVDYRQRLAARSWELIQQHPYFGNQTAFMQMGDLRQGEGIIDFVNSYAQIALFYGLIGLGALVGFMLLGVFRTYRQSRRTKAIVDLQLLGVSLMATIAGVLILLSTTSFIFALPVMFYALGGCAAAYSRLPAPAPTEVPVPVLPASPAAGPPL